MADAVGNEITLRVEKAERKVSKFQHLVDIELVIYILWLCYHAPDAS
jgi:hypothetical protein